MKLVVLHEAIPTYLAEFAQQGKEQERLIEQLWQIVYVDGKMDKYEHYLMNKLSNLLRLSHKQLIDAKLKVLHGS